MNLNRKKPGEMDGSELVGKLNNKFVKGFRKSFNKDIKQLDIYSPIVHKIVY